MKNVNKIPMMFTKKEGYEDPDVQLREIYTGTTVMQCDLEKCG